MSYMWPHVSIIVTYYIDVINFIYVIYFFTFFIHVTFYYIVYGFLKNFLSFLI